MLPWEEKEEGRNAAEQCVASGPEAEVTGLAFITKPVWKHESLNKRKSNYKLPFDHDSGGLSQSQHLQNPQGKKIFRRKATLCLLQHHS